MITALRLAWKLGGFKGVLRAIPRGIWIAIGILALCGIAYWAHSNSVSKFEAQIRRDEHAKVDAAWQTSFDKMQKAAGLWKQKYETNSQTLSTARKNSHEKYLADIAAHADRLHEAGPGKASVRSVCAPIVSSSSSGHVAVAGTGSSGLPRVSYPEWSSLIAMPFDDTTELLKIAAANWAEAATWRAHDAEQRALYEKMVQDLKAQTAKAK